jgi:hypothetical protein
LRRVLQDGRGYFDVIDDRARAEQFQQRCPKCAKPMYPSDVEMLKRFGVVRLRRVLMCNGWRAKG